MEIEQITQTLGEYCKDHKKFKLRFICFSPKCTLHSICCPIEVKTTHRNCNPELIVDQALLNQIIEVRPCKNMDELRE